VVLVTGSGPGGFNAACDFLGSLSEAGFSGISIIVALVPDASGGFTDTDFEGCSAVPISLVTAGTRFEPGNVYVAPKRGSFELSNGRFSCTPPASYRNLGVEMLGNATRSLAELFGDKLALLVMSGSRKCSTGMGKITQNVISGGGQVIIQAGASHTAHR
jgi:chemotaxis response regulator CheB